MIIDELEAIGGTVIVILDEIDAIGSDDYILYELPRAEPDDVRLSIIGITNDLQFREGLDADVRSSLSEDEIEFAPYDANQLRDILARRAAGAPATPRSAMRTSRGKHSRVPCSLTMPSHSPVRSPPRTPATLVRQSSCCSAPAGSPTTRANSRSLSSTSAMPTSTFEQAAVERGIKSLPLQRALAL